jgi:2-polyprenyl-3-methyl-5-hydroxy-6-metoxy-1,4-benzoquinol methylase
MPAERIYFFPLITLTSGSGHFRRSVETATAVSKTGRTSIFVDSEESEKAGFSGLSAPVPVRFFKPADLVETAAGSNEASAPATKTGFNDTLVVFDRKFSDGTRLLDWVRAGATPVLLDDDGPARIRAPFVLDSIPGPRRSPANIASPAFLNLPGRRREPDARNALILLSFGGFDPAGLTVPVLRSLILDAGIPSRRISLTLPTSADPGMLPEGVTILEQVTGLKDRLGDYGLVICSYGITAWEALAAGCAVLTAEPTIYHRRLSRRAGIPSIGKVQVRKTRGELSLGPAGRRRLERQLAHPEVLENLAAAAAACLGNRVVPGASPDQLSGLLKSLEAPRAVCAVCREPLPRVIFRMPGRSFYRCGNCHITGLYRFELKEDEYGPSYFQQEYRNQYGRSYLEDFETIKAMATERLAIIRKQNPGSRLLDIGCAFGPFLKAAHEAGFRPCGVDVSREGTEYVRDVLGIPAAAGAFPEFDPAEHFGIDKFDVVSLWYVIEHFPDLKTVMDALNRLLRTGGVLALSTPNLRGISGVRSIKAFLENSPRDHYTLWSPRSARRLARRFGFRVRRIRVTGHHPERFGLKMRPGGPVHRLIGVFSRLFGLGDTFEMYAVKERSIG